jgi:hypothetical protein
MTDTKPLKRNCNIRERGDCDSSRVHVPQSVKEALQPAFGYTPGHLAADLTATFETPIPPRRHLKCIAQSWEASALYDHPGSCSPLQARSAAASYSSFFARFPRTILHRDLLELAGEDPAQAAQSLLEIIDAEIDSDTSGVAGADIRGLARALDQARNGLRVPFSPPGYGRSEAGNISPAAIKRLWNIQGLLERLKLQYKPYKKRAVRNQEVPYPDDLNIIGLRSFGANDLMRITTNDLLLPEGVFYQRLAMRDLRQVVYQESIPEPPRRFSMLLDSSGSMKDKIDGEQFSRADYAVASAIVLLQSALANGNEVILRTFDSRPSSEMIGSPQDLSVRLIECPFSGGGTSIRTALEAAEGDNSEEIIMVTDGDDDDIPEDLMTPLVVYQVDDHNNTPLRQLARAYHIIG